MGEQDPGLVDTAVRAHSPPVATVEGMDTVPYNAARDMQQQRTVEEQTQALVNKGQGTPVVSRVGMDNKLEVP